MVEQTIYLTILVKKKIHLVKDAKDLQKNEEEIDIKLLSLVIREMGQFYKRHVNSQM